MPEGLPTRHSTKTAGTYAALALFLAAYIGVLAVVLAPRSVMPVETGAIFTAGE